MMLDYFHGNIWSHISTLGRSSDVARLLFQKIKEDVWRASGGARGQEHLENGGVEAAGAVPVPSDVSVVHGENLRLFRPRFCHLEYLEKTWRHL